MKVYLKSLLENRKSHINHMQLSGDFIPDKHW